MPQHFSNSSVKNEATKMALRVPLFYGNKKEDTINIKDFIDRFESACTAMELNKEQEKCNLFVSFLRGEATALYINATNHGMTVNNRRSVKEHFMFRYKGKVETNKFCHQILKLFKEKGEMSVTLPKDALQKFENSSTKLTNPQMINLMPIT